MKYKNSIAEIRLSSNNLSIETGRYSNTIKASRSCISCADCVGDNYHFILFCPVYANFRRKYIKEYYCKRPSRFKLVKLFNAESYITMFNSGSLFLIL